MKSKLFILSTVVVSSSLLAACTPAAQDTAEPTTAATMRPAATATPRASAEAMDSKDGVMVGGAMMSPLKKIPENASAASNLTTLVKAVTAAGLVETLNGNGPFTVFAPTDTAFAKVPKATLDGLLKPTAKADLTNVLTYHVVAGRYTAKDLKDGQKLKTVQGEELTVAVKAGKVTVNGANVETADVMQANGVVHVIDTVLMPKGKGAAASASPSAKASASASGSPRASASASPRASAQ